MRQATTESTPHWQRLIRLPAFLIASIALFALIGVSTARETYRGWTVDREIHALEAQAADLEGRKMKLAELTNQLASSERVELDARARLGWKREGEKVYVLSGYQPPAKADAVSATDVPTAITPSNPQRWVSYFLHSN